jgi:hypothetical protein
MSRPLWLCGSRSHHLAHCFVSERSSTGLPFLFVFIRTHFRHPAWTQFPKTKFIRQYFVKKWPWNLWQMQRKWRNGESCVLLNFSSTTRTKFSLTTDAGRSVENYAQFCAIQWSVSPISLPLNHSLHALHTPHEVDDECQPISCFLHSSNGLRTAFDTRRDSRFSWTL